MSQREIEQLRRELKRERREKEEAKAREEEAKAREEQERRKTQKTTLPEYLYNCHFDLYEKLELAGKPKSSTGYTKVEGKYYPKWLRPWDEFTNTQHQRLFEQIWTVCGERRLFHQQSTTDDLGRSIIRKIAGNENAIDYFEKLVVEDPTWEILSPFLNEDMRRIYGATSLRFSNNIRDFTHSSDSSHLGDDAIEERQPRRRRTGPNKRVASEQRVKPSFAKPDGGGIRTHLDGNETLAFVSDYKAAHKVAVRHVKATVAKEKLFMEVTQRINGDKSKNNVQLREQEDAEALIAMALTQVFDYMIRYGVAYGYVAAGKCLLFLHVDRSDLQTLYCRPCVPGEDVGEASAGPWETRACYTAVAQLTSFCLLSLRLEALQGARLDSALQIAEATLRKWREPYEGAAGLLDADDMASHPASSSPTTEGSEFKSSARPASRDFLLRSRSSCRGPPVFDRKDDDEEDGDDGPYGDPFGPPMRTETGKRKGGPPSGSSGEEDVDVAEPAPSKQYCTQACLLGLKKRWDLDYYCPNVFWHRSAGCRHHPIDADKFTRLVAKQLENPYRYCEALNSWGKAGSTGVLFKVELVPYGYTLVCKGTVSGHLQTLEHESRIYAHLDELQGDVVPVHLGLVHLDWGYILPGGARVVDMMLMSWGGDTVKSAKLGEVDLEKEVRRASQAIWARGVVHGDEHDNNRLWNNQCGRVMLVDFDHAKLWRTPKHKRLVELSGNERKRKRNGSRHHELKGGLLRNQQQCV